MLSIANEVDPLFFHCARAYFHQMVSEWSSFWICITCFVSFGIRDNSFMLLEDHAFNFLHGCWNDVLIKTEIGVMMLFKFEFKYVKLIFKAIVSMKFSFDIILWLSCSYVSCLFKKNRRKFLEIRVSRVLIDQKSFSIDRVKQWSNFLNILIFDCSKINRICFSIDREAIEYRSNKSGGQVRIF